MPMINCPTCGAGLKVPEGMGGRKARCNKCQSVFTIPAGAGPAPAPVPAAPEMRMAPPASRAMPAMAPAAPLPTAPLPRTGPPPVPAMPLPPAPAGYAPPAPGQAPPAGYAPPPPGFAPGQPYPPGAIAPAPRRGPRPMSADGPGPRRRRKKGSSVLLWSLIGGGAFLLIGVVVLLMFLLWGGGGPGAELAYMPDNAEMIAQVQVASLRASGAFKTLTKDDKSLENELNQTKQRIGIEIDDINSIMFGGKKAAKEPVMAVRTKKGYSADQILENLNWKSNSSKSKEGNFEIHKNNGTNMAFCVVNSNVVVYGTDEELHKIFKRNGQPSLSADLKSAMNSVSFSSTAAFAAAGDGVKEAKGEMGFMPGMDDSKFSAPQSVAGTVNLSSNINISINVFFKDSTTATDMVKVIDGGLTAAKNMQQMEKNMKSVLERVSVSASGARVTGTANGIDPEWLKGNSKGMSVAGMIPNYGGPGPIGPGPINPGPVGPGPNPVVNTTPVLRNGVTKRSGSFQDQNVMVNPNDRYTYEVQCKGGGQCTFNIKPQFDAIMNIQIKQGGATISSDQGLRNNFSLSWHAPTATTYQIEIVSTDTLSNNCSITFTDPGAPGGFNPNPNPNPTGTGKQLMNTSGTVFGGGFKTHSIFLQAGQPCVIKCKSLGGFDPVIELISPTGQLVAADDDGDGFPNCRINYNPLVAGNYQIKVRGFGNSSGGYNLTVHQ